MTEPIFHITSKASWAAAQSTGEYSPGSLASEGFIHCSKMDQILRVADSFFANHHGLVMLVIDLPQVKSETRWEAGTDKADELFPHIYGPINLNAVLRVIDFEPESDGQFKLPQMLSSLGD